MKQPATTGVIHGVGSALEGGGSLTTEGLPARSKILPALTAALDTTSQILAVSLEERKGNYQLGEAIIMVIQASCWLEKPVFDLALMHENRINRGSVCKSALIPVVVGYPSGQRNRNRVR
jgi:hypothetical protein